MDNLNSNVDNVGKKVKFCMLTLKAGSRYYDDSPSFRMVS